MFGGRSQELPSGLCQQVPSHHRPLVSQQLSQCPAKVLWTSGFHVWHLLPSYTDPSSTTGILDQLCLWSCQSRWAGFNTVIFSPDLIWKLKNTFEGSSRNLFAIISRFHFFPGMNPWTSLKIEDICSHRHSWFIISSLSGIHGAYLSMIINILIIHQF
jgi:hypothetical protein